MSTFKIFFNKNFQLLWIASGISTLGDWVLAASLPFYVYILTGSALATGTMFLIEAIPRVAFSYLAGIFADRWNKKQIMIFSDASRALLLLFLFFVHTTQMIWIIYLVSFVETTISLLFAPAQGALLPELIEKEEWTSMNTWGTISDNFCRLVGPIVGGALLSFTGLYSVILFDILSYIISGLLIMGVRQPVVTPLASAPALSENHSPTHSFWSQGITGLRFLFQTRWLLVLSIVTGLSMFAQGIINVLLIVFANQSLHSNAFEVGWILSVQGIGGIIGGFFIGTIAKKLSSTRLLAFSLIAVGILFLCIVEIPVYGFDLFLFGLAGFPVVGWIVSISTLLQHVDRTHRGRVLGVYSSIQTVAIIIGMGFASILGTFVRASIPLSIAAAFLILSGTLSSFALKREAIDAQRAPLTEPVTMNVSSK